MKTNQRTRNGEGVTVPSQRKYVEYFEMYMKYMKAGAPPPLAEKVFAFVVRFVFLFALCKDFLVAYRKIPKRCKYYRYKYYESVVLKGLPYAHYTTKFTFKLTFEAEKSVVVVLEKIKVVGLSRFVSSKDLQICVDYTPGDAALHEPHPGVCFITFETVEIFYLNYAYKIC
jgi:hypothetical protein